MKKAEIVRGNPLYFPEGNENGNFYEPLWIAKRDNLMEHGRTPTEAMMKLLYAESYYENLHHSS